MMPAFGPFFENVCESIVDSTQYVVADAVANVTGASPAPYLPFSVA